MKIKVLLVDDHPVVRHGLRSLLSKYPDIDVVGDSEGGMEVLTMSSDLQPDVVLMDVRLDGPSGLALARRLKREQPRVRVIILTSYDDDEYLLQAARAGARAYLLKTTSAEDLADTIRAVRAGERRLSPELVGKVMQGYEALSQAHAQAVSGLADDDIALLRLMADGATTAEMAEALFVSERTVKRKLQDLMAALGASNRTQAVALAYERDLL